MKKCPLLYLQYPRRSEFSFFINIIVGQDWGLRDIGFYESASSCLWLDVEIHFVHQADSS